LRRTWNEAVTLFIISREGPPSPQDAPMINEDSKRLFFPALVRCIAFVRLLRGRCQDVRINCLPRPVVFLLPTFTSARKVLRELLFFCPICGRHQHFPACPSLHNLSSFPQIGWEMVRIHSTTLPPLYHEDLHRINGRGQIRAPRLDLSLERKITRRPTSTNRNDRTWDETPLLLVHRLFSIPNHETLCGYHAA